MNCGAAFVAPEDFGFLHDIVIEQRQVTAMHAEQFGSIVKTDIAKWAKVIKFAGIKSE